MGKVEKQTARQIFLTEKRNISDREYDRRSDQIARQTISLIGKLGIKTVHSYLSISKNREPDTKKIIQYLFDNNVKTIVSKTNFKDKSMSHFTLTPKTELAENSFGIPEPKDAESADLTIVDLFLIPLVGLDRKGNRLGYGGGYYDQMLSDSKAVKVGLSILPPTMEFNFVELHDITLDYGIFPDEMIKFR